MDYVLHNDKNGEDKSHCERLVMSAGVDYTQFGNITNLIKKRELGNYGASGFIDTVNRLVVSHDAGQLRRVRYECDFKRICIHDPPEQPFSNFPCVVFRNYANTERENHVVIDLLYEPLISVSELSITRATENVRKVLRRDAPIRVEIIPDEPLYNLITLERDGSLVGRNTKTGERVAHKLTLGRFKGDLEWNIYGEDFYVFLQTSECYGHSLIAFDFYPFRCKYKMKVPIMQNVRHISLHRDILKCSLCNRTEFYYLKDLLKHPVAPPPRTEDGQDGPIEFTIPNFATPFFSLNFSSYNTEVKLISDRFLAITFPYHVKTVCFRDLRIASTTDDCPNIFYTYDQLHIPDDNFNRFYIAKDNLITCHMFCSNTSNIIKTEVVWQFDIFASKPVHPLFTIEGARINYNSFKAKVEQLSPGKIFRFLTLGSFDHYILAACHFLVCPSTGAYHYKSYLYLLDILTGKALAVASLPTRNRNIQSVHDLTDDMLYEQDMHLVRLGSPQGSLGTTLCFRTGTVHRQDYWESEDGTKELTILKKFRSIERITDISFFQE